MDFMKLLREERARARAAASSTKIETNSNNSNEIKGGDSQTDIVSETTVASRKAAQEAQERERLEEDRKMLQTMHYHLVDLKLPHEGNLHRFVVGKVPTLIYIPDVISEDEEQKLMGNISMYDKNWRSLRGRKLQCWGGNPDGSASDGVFSTLSPWLTNLCESLVRNGVFEPENSPNHVLINQYNTDEGIIHHTDGPKYFNRVAILSLQSTRLMTFRHRLRPEEVGVKYGGDLFSVCLRPRSLLIFQDDLYSEYLHGLSDGIEEDEVGGEVEDQGKGDAKDAEAVPCVNSDLAGVVPGVKVRSFAVI